MYKTLLIIGLIITITSCNTAKKQKVKAIGHNTYAIDNESDFFFLDTLSNQNGKIKYVYLTIRDSIQLSRPIIIKDKGDLNIHILSAEQVTQCITANNTPCLIIDNCNVKIDKVNFSSINSDDVIRSSNSGKFTILNTEVFLHNPFSENSNAINIKNVKQIRIDNSKVSSKNTKSGININQTDNFSMKAVSFLGSQKHNLILENTSEKNFIRNCVFNNYTETAIYTTNSELKCEENEFIRNKEHDTESLIAYPDSVRHMMFPWEKLIDMVFYNDNESHRYEFTDSDNPNEYEYMPSEFIYVIEDYNLYRIMDQFIEDEMPSSNHLFDEVYAFEKDFNSVMKKMAGVPVFIDKDNSIADEWCYNEDGEARFLLYNPEYFQWLRKSLTFDKLETEKKPEEQTWWIEYDYYKEPVEWDYFDIYYNLFRGLFRNYYVIYKYLYDAENTNEIIALFKQAGDKNRWFNNEMCKIMLFHTQSPYNISYAHNDSIQTTLVPKEITEDLQESFNHLTLHSHVSIKNQKIPQFSFPRIGAFWMRRTLDRSAPELFKTLEHYMRIFDKKWINTFNNPQGPVTEINQEEGATLSNQGCTKYGEPDSIYTVNKSNAYKLFWDEDLFKDGLVDLCLEGNPDLAIENLGNCKLLVILENDEGHTVIHPLYNIDISLSNYEGTYEYFIEKFITHTDDVKNAFYYTDETNNEKKLMRFLPEGIANGKYKIQIAIYVEDENLTIYSNVVKVDVPLQEFTG